MTRLELLILKRTPVTRCLVLLAFGSCLCSIASLAIQQDKLPGAHIYGLLVISMTTVVLYLSNSKYSEKVVSTAISLVQVSMASLLIAQFGGVYTSHFLMIVSLSVVAFYRNRRLLAVAAAVAIIEQSVLSVMNPGLLFPANIPDRNSELTQYLCWLLGTAALYIAASDDQELLSPETFVSPEASLELRKEKRKKMRELIPQAGEELYELSNAAAGRLVSLRHAIASMDGPLRRILQSVNVANSGLQEIKAELVKTASSVIQVSMSSEMHAIRASDVFQAADASVTESQIGAESSEESIRNMDKIREQMESIEKNMDNLLDKSQMMVQVVGFADEIALQSKVLSVNAAIEAAKAGDRGQGFSAVAREVKTLANQSKEATRQVRQILKEIQKSISDVRQSVVLGNETVELACEQCRSTADSINGLDESVAKSRDAAEAIMNSSIDQVQGIMMISHAMSDIQAASEYNSSSLNDLQLEAQKLNSISKEVIAELANFQKLVEQLAAECLIFEPDKSGG